MDYTITIYKTRPRPNNNNVQMNSNSGHTQENNKFNYIVTLKQETDVDRYVTQLRSSRNGQVEIEHVYRKCLNGFTLKMSENEAEVFKNSENVMDVEKDGVIFAMGNPDNDVSTKSDQSLQTNPPWGLDRISQRDLPLTGDYIYDTDASGVNIYIFDTGINIHHTDFDGRATLGHNIINDGHSALDCDGHGTHVAGSAGSTTYGVAKGANLISVRVLNSEGVGNTSGLIAGIEWLADNVTFPSVVNLSLGGPTSQSLDTAINSSIDMGIVYIVAAGNDNSDACNFSPARISRAITVGSSTRDDKRSSFSNYGSCVNIFAPGSEILSSWHTSLTDTRIIGGTSMAAGFVSGVAAIYLAHNPNSTPEQVMTAILENGTSDHLDNIGSNSPNLLLYSLFTIEEPPEEPIPDVPCTDCTYYAGNLTGSEDSKFEPNGNFYTTNTSGNHNGWLRGPENTDFDLYLLKWDGNSWSTVASSLSSTSTEHISYSGTAGNYVWLIYSYSGSGPYDLWLQGPT